MSGNHPGTDEAVLLDELRACADADYFERGLERTIARRGLHVAPVDVSASDVVEVDFLDDLERADRIEAANLRTDPQGDPGS